MADVFKLSDGGNSEVVLLYDSAPGFQMIMSGIKFGTPDHDMQYHQSDYLSGEMLTRERITNRRWPLKLALKGNSDDNNIGNELIELNRLIRQARRYHLNDGDVAEVYLEVKLDGATNTTYYTLIDGVVKADIFDKHNRNTGDVKFGAAVAVELTTKPQGYGAQTTLENELINPHFEEDGHNDGLADGWIFTGSTAFDSDSVTLDVNNWFTTTGGNARGEWYAQEFTASYTGHVQRAVIKLKRVGTPAGTVTASIFSSDGTGEPSTIIGDASSAVTIATGVSSAGQDDVTFTWATEGGQYPKLTASTNYFLVLKTIGYTYAGATTTALAVGTDADGTSGDEVFSYDANDADVWEVVGANHSTNYSVSGLALALQTRYMVGTQSQRITTGTTGTEGIRSNTVDCSNNQSQDFVAYAYVCLTSGDDDITLDIVGDDSGSIGTKAYSNVTTTYTGGASNTWKRLEVLGATNSTDTTLQMRVERLTGDASTTTAYWVDKCYLQLNQSSVPDAWMSCSHIKNYFETATEGAVPFIDVVDIPGDLKAETVYLIESDSVENIYIGRWSRSSPAAFDDYFTTGTGNTDAARAGNLYDTSTVGDSAYVQVFTKTGLDNITPGKYCVLTAMRVSTSTATMLMEGGSTIDAGSNWNYSDDKSLSLTTTYKLFASLPIDFSNYQQANIDSAGYTVRLKSSSDTHVVYTDFLMLMPVDEGYCVIGNTLTTNTKSFVLEEDIDGSSSAYVMTTADSTDPHGRIILGKLIKLEPDKEQRLLFMTNSTSDAHVLASGDITVKLRYRPQTEFLLGTT